MGITVPPSIDMGAPMGAKSPILQILGPPWGPPWGPMGRPMGPHGGPNGGQFPPWGTTFFLTLFWRVNTPSRESPIYVRVRMYPYFVHAKISSQLVERVQSYRGKKNHRPPWTIGTLYSVPILRRPCWVLFAVYYPGAIRVIFGQKGNFLRKIAWQFILNLEQEYSVS